MRGALVCGTSGWQYREFRGAFYPEELRSADLLRYYSERFSAVEVNSTFYHFSRPSTFAKWRGETPDHFSFAIKANRYFTHFHRLGDPEDRMPAFIESLDALGDKLGPILFQLPPSLHFDPDRLEAFIERLPREDRLRYVFEFRHPTWDCDETYEILSRSNVAICVYDLRGYQSPPMLTANFGYVRLHGPLKQPYRGSYSDEALQTWAKRLKKWTGSGRDAFIFFDNTMTADAIPNAEFLIRAFAREGSPPRLHPEPMMPL